MTDAPAADRAAPLSELALNQLFLEARTRNGWRAEAVPETLIRAVYDLAKMGPTSANCSPARFLFVHTPEGKARLMPHLSEGNQAKSQAAPWNVVIATDTAFYDKIPQLFPHNPGAREWFSSPEASAEHGMRNGTLQGAYLMIAARSLGLDCGPMSGFDKAGVDREFFESDPARATWKSNWVCNLGYGDDTDLHPRLPRLSFEEACGVV